MVYDAYHFDDSVFGVGEDQFKLVQRFLLFEELVGFIDNLARKYG